MSITEEKAERAEQLKPFCEGCQSCERFIVNAVARSVANGGIIPIDWNDVTNPPCQCPPLRGLYGANDEDE